MKRETKTRFFPLLLSIILLIITVNPYVENLMNVNPIPYMLAHYSLYASGIFISYYVLRLKKNHHVYLPLMLGIFLAVLWHLPYFFNLGIINLAIRGIEEATLFLGGLFMGIAMKSLSMKYKIALLILWMLGDMYVAGVLMIVPREYTYLYSIAQLSLLGIIMFLMMTFIDAFLLTFYFYKLMLEEKGSAG